MIRAESARQRRHQHHHPEGLVALAEPDPGLIQQPLCGQRLPQSAETFLNRPRDS